MEIIIALLLGITMAAVGVLAYVVKLRTHELSSSLSRRVEAAVQMDERISTLERRKPLVEVVDGKIAPVRPVYRTWSEDLPAKDGK